MPGHRNLVRALVGAALCVALAACVFLPIPESLPSIALGLADIYRLEVALAVFYGCLLMVTPAYSGLAAGRLPIEISTQGAKFAAETDWTAERDETAIKELEQTTDRLWEQLERALVEIGQLRADRG